MKGIFDIHVDSFGLVSRRCSIGWDTHDGMRWHIWIDADTGLMAHGVLFKNCPANLKSGDPGHFHARRLDPTKKANAAMIAHVRGVVKREGLVAKAEEAARENERQRDAENAKAYAEHLKKEAGPELYSAAVTALAALERVAPQARGALVIQDIERAIRDLRGAITHADTPKG